MSSRPRPPERRRLETNCGLRSRAASELTDRSLPKRSRPAAFIGPSSSLPSWTGLHATTSDAGGRSSSLTAGAFELNTPQEAAIWWAESGAGHPRKINSAGLDDQHP